MCQCACARGSVAFGGPLAFVSSRNLCRTGNELCERLAYYGLATNLVTYMTRVMGGDPANAAILVRACASSCRLSGY